MKLYHFTADLLLESIKAEGLTRGSFPLQINGDLKLLPDCQWLTRNKTFDQLWHDPEFTQLKYDRRENRIAIKIPKNEYENLWNWEQVKIGFGHLFLRDFDYHDDCQNWYIFLGRIKPGWFRGITRK